MIKIPIAIGCMLLLGFMLLVSACTQPLPLGELRWQSPLPIVPIIVKHAKPDLPPIDTRVFSDTIRVADPADDAAKKKYEVYAQSVGSCQPAWDQPG